MIYTILIILNIVALFLRSDKRFWVVSVPLWIILVAGFISWRIFTDRQIKIAETAYQKTTMNNKAGDNAKWIALEISRKENQHNNRVILNMIGLQTLLAFIFQVIGQKKTKQKIYGWTKVIFGVLLLLIAILFLLMGIVPSTGYIT